MSQRYAELGARIASVGQLDSVVAAMRGIAAARALASRKQLAGVNAYAEIVAGAIAQALALLPDKPAEVQGRDEPRLCVLFCAEQGFAGAYSERIFAAAGLDEGSGSARPARPLLLVGRRGLRLAKARGLKIEWSTPMIAQLGMVGALAHRIVYAIHAQMQAAGGSSADIVYAAPSNAAGDGITVQRRSLLPLDRGRFNRSSPATPPLLNLPPSQLLDALASEYLFAELCAAILDSYAAENTMRMLTMAAARDNIVRRLDSLSLEQRLARQDGITAELVELVAGSESALHADRPRPPAGAA
jgi:F-type H+-transporting ATPase subunit gamma